MASLCLYLLAVSFSCSAHFYRSLLIFKFCSISSSFSSILVLTLVFDAIERFKRSCCVSLLTCKLELCIVPLVFTGVLEFAVALPLMDPSLISRRGGAPLSTFFVVLIYGVFETAAALTEVSNGLE